MRSLRTKLVVFILLMFMLLGLVLTSLVYFQMSGELKDGLNQSLGATVQGQANVIHGWVADRSKVVEAAVAVAEQPDPRPTLASLTAAGGFDLSFIGYADKRMLYSNNQAQAANYDPTARPWYILAQQTGKTSLTEPYVDFDTHKLVVTFASPVMKDGALKAVAGADVFIDALVKSVLSLKLQADGYAFLVNREGKVIAHPDQALTLKALSERITELNAAKIAELAGAGALGEVNSNGTAYFTRLVPVEGTAWYLGVVVDRSQVLAPLNKLLYSVLGMALLALVLIVPLIGVVFGRMLKGLHGLRDAMQEISHGEGDLTRRIQITGQDEIAQTAQAFNTFIERLHKMFLVVRDEAGQVTQRVEQVGDTVKGVADDSRQISDVSSTNAATLEQITVSISQIADIARDADGLVVRTGEVSTNSAEAMDRISGEMARTMSAVRDLSSMLTSLDSRSEQISGITNVIKDIADQTNLLALNAAIEAARAGEQGRGFAVVADEVRKLAERTSQATVEITGTVSAIRDETRQAVTNMQHTISSVDDGVALTQSAAAHIDEIRQAMHTVVQKMGEIARSTREQHSAANQIAQSTEGINNRIVESDSALQNAHLTLSDLSKSVATMRHSFAHFKL
jgi:methyl-accepting chemotaxis protein